LQTAGFSIPSVPVYIPTVRELLTTARTYYVRADGNDSNTGLADSSGGAFRHPQKAVDVITGPTLDLGGQTVTVKLGDGTSYNNIVFDKPWTGGGAVKIQGNTGDRSAVYINQSSSPCIRINITLPGLLWLEYLKLNSTYQTCIDHWGVGTVMVKEINFVGANTHIFSANPGAYIIVYDDYEISGSCSNCHAFSNNAGASMYLDGYTVGAFTVTLTGTPDLGYGFANAGNLGEVYISSNLTFSGSATGYRFYVWNNAIIGVEGAGDTYLPGDVAGVEETGGLYA
jgi:hypothetical protein